jgi:hypothetical protein
MAISVTGLTTHTQTGGGTWIDYGTGGGSSSNTTLYVSSTGSRARKFTGAKGFAYEVNASGTDLSNSIIVIRYLLNGGYAATLAAGGGILRLEDTSGNQSDFYIDGSDTYSAGWKVVVIDTANTESANNGTAATLTAVRYVGLVVNAAAASGGDPNFYIDEVLSMPNTGLTMAGNTTNLFDELATWDDTSKYGVVTKVGPITYSKCPLIASPDASDHASTDEVIVFEEPIYEDGTNIDSALTLQGLSSSDADTITFTRLTAICEDNGTINGTHADKELDFTSASDIVANDSTFRGFNGTTVHLGTTTNDYTGCTFQDCSQVVDTGAVIRQCIFRNSTTTSGSYLWDNTNTDLQNCVFDVASGGHGIEHDTIESVATGTVTTPDATGVTLTDSGASFLSTVSAGEYVYNETDNSYAKVVTVDSNTQITTDGLTGGTDDQFGSSDAYSISPAQAYTDITFTGAGTHVNNTATGSDGLFISKAGTSNPSTSTGNVVFIGSVTVTITVYDESSTVISAARVGVYLTSDRTEVLNADTNGSGVATTNYTGTTPAAVEIRARKASSADSPKYKNFSSLQTIGASGLDFAVTMLEDPNNNATT